MTSAERVRKFRARRKYENGFGFCDCSAIATCMHAGGPSCEACKVAVTEAMAGLEKWSRVLRSDEYHIENDVRENNLTRRQEYYQNNRSRIAAYNRDYQRKRTAKENPKLKANQKFNQFEQR